MEEIDKKGSGWTEGSGKVTKIRDNVYHIYDSLGVFCTLIMGPRGALLVDTGYGFGSIAQTAREVIQEVLAQRKTVSAAMDRTSDTAHTADTPNAGCTAEAGNQADSAAVGRTSDTAHTANSHSANRTFAAGDQASSSFPITVINTHGHVDHIQENKSFDHVYMHPADNALMKSHSSAAFKAAVYCASRRKLTKEEKKQTRYFFQSNTPKQTRASDGQSCTYTPSAETGTYGRFFQYKPYVRTCTYDPAAPNSPKSPITTCRPASPNSLVSTDLPHIIPLADGQIIDYGGASAEIMHTPGHTAGSVCILDRANRVLLSGDTFSSHVWLFLKESQSLDIYRQSIEKARARTADFDIILSGHSAAAFRPTLLDTIARCAANYRAQHSTPFTSLGGRGLLYMEGFEKVTQKYGYTTFKDFMRNIRTISPEEIADIEFASLVLPVHDADSASAELASADAAPAEPSPDESAPD